MDFFQIGNSRRRRGTEASNFLNDLDFEDAPFDPFEAEGTGGGRNVAFINTPFVDEDDDDDDGTGGDGTGGASGTGGGGSGGFSGGFSDVDFQGGGDGEFGGPVGDGTEFGFDLGDAAFGAARGAVTGGIPGAVFGGLTGGIDISPNDPDDLGDDVEANAEALGDDDGTLSGSGIGDLSSGIGVGAGASQSSGLGLAGQISDAFDDAVDAIGSVFSGDDSGGGDDFGGGDFGGADVAGGDEASGAADVGGDGGGGGGGGTVICTELLRQGMFPADMYAEKCLRTSAIPDSVIRGYHFWAIPYVRLMRKSPLATRFIAPFALAWAGDRTAFAPSVMGKILRIVGEPVCHLIGLFVKKADYSKLYGGKNA